MGKTKKGTRKFKRKHLSGAIGATMLMSPGAKRLVAALVAALGALWMGFGSNPSEQRGSFVEVLDAPDRIKLSQLRAENFRPFFLSIARGSPLVIELDGDSQPGGLSDDLFRLCGSIEVSMLSAPAKVRQTAGTTKTDLRTQRQAHACPFDEPF